MTLSFSDEILINNSFIIKSEHIAKCRLVTYFKFISVFDEVL